MKLLFHCCCGPCATACTESLAAEGIAPTLFWYNPNIHPLSEYQHRRDAFIAFAEAKNLKREMRDEYCEWVFLDSIGSETEAPQRCEQCYRMRLEQTADYAAENGFDAFSTSLLISPYQQHETIRAIGEKLAAKYNLQFFYRDFRPLFRQSRDQARALGLYMQKYCGCMFSVQERFTKQSFAPDHQDTQQQSINLEPGQNPLFQRLALLAGGEVLEKLSKASVLVVGAGGVGSWCAEGLVRSGVGRIGIIDFDTVCASNVNRQVQATSLTLGQVKVEALKQRLLEINPQCKVTAWKEAFSRENAGKFGIETAHYVIDAIDSLTCKLDLIEAGCAAGVTFFSSMGMAQKIDPTRIKTADIWETHGCPLARLVRQGLRKRGFSGNFTAVYSDERLERHYEHTSVNGSIVTVTATAGMALASLVLHDIMGH